ncbi:hypothetical protein [Flavobacterium terrigena]|uniref:NlpE N-terminal domain-containing protein n=1 Tax=Flavobacterium terrigena TaxID=402734 RepID=A0A1H6UTU3_9FLAO|nr:hypothetical protein [Flavobacterium terrigena]SEI94084.1 hypothetical protein SAMN05660918_1987 [Flavobacterium terrigena]
MKKLTILFFTALTMLNCKKKEVEKIENSTPQEVVTDEKVTPQLDLGCYIFNDGKNNVSFEITENGEEIKGNLNYAYAEKDKNSGSFSGKLNDGILLGKYTFQSEGKESVREVAFKVEDDKIIEGYGDLNEDGTTFKDATHLSFTSKMPLTKTECNKK